MEILEGILSNQQLAISMMLTWQMFIIMREDTFLKIWVIAQNILVSMIRIKRDSIDIMLRE